MHSENGSGTSHHGAVGPTMPLATLVVCTFFFFGSVPCEFVPGVSLLLVGSDVFE